jgi:hypothetical protein
LAEADPLESPFVAHVTQLCEQTETKTSSSGGEISGEGRWLCDTSAISRDADPTSTPRFTGTDVTRLSHCSEMTARAGRVMYVYKSSPVVGQAPPIETFSSLHLAHICQLIAQFISQLLAFHHVHAAD